MTLAALAALSSVRPALALSGPRRQLGGAVEQWLFGAVNCVIIVFLMAAVSFVAVRRKTHRLTFCIVGWTTILGLVYCTQYIPVLRDWVFDPIVRLGQLM